MGDGGGVLAHPSRIRSGVRFAKFLLVEGGALPGKLVRWLMGIAIWSLRAFEGDVICRLA